MPDRLHIVRKVMVADTAEGYETLRSFLDEAAALAHVSSFDEAVEMLRWQPDLILCGMHFDDARMFDLLRVAMASRDFKGKPFVCYRDLDSDLPGALLEALEIACRAAGPARFVDVYRLKREHGAARTGTAFRNLIDECLKSQ